MRFKIGSKALGLALFCAIAVPLNAHGAPATHANANANARQSVQDFARRLHRLIAAQRYDEARALAREKLGHAPEAPLHLGHLEGLILEQKGRYKDAATVFRRVLTLDPNFTPSRIELAKALYRLGETEAAMHHLEAVHLGAREGGLRRLVEGYIAEVDRERDYGVNGYISIAPSTNINRGTTADEFVSDFGVGRIGDESRKTSGVGVGAGANAYKRWRLSADSAVLLTGSADLRDYSGDDYDQLVLATNLAYIHDFGAFSVRAGPAAEYRLVAWDPYWVRLGGTFGVNVPVGESSLLSTNVTVLNQNYAEADYRDGWLGEGTVTFRHLFSPSLQLSLTADATMERTRLDHLDHNDLGGRFQIDKEWRGGLLTTIYAGYETHDYLGDFPFLSEARHDTQWRVGGHLAHRSLSFEGFAPQIYYQYTRQSSNVAFYDYDSHDFGVTLTRKF